MDLHRISPLSPRGHTKPSSGFIRGGRLRKTSKGLMSFAPFLAGASILALGALLATSSPVQAGSCTLQGSPSAANGHNVLCTGVAESDDTQTIQSSIAGAALEITDDGTFGLNVSNGRGLSVIGGSMGTSVNVNISGDISAQNNAVDVNQEGTGAVTVMMGGAITSSAGRGINVVTAAATTGDVTVTAGGNVTTQATGTAGNGIFVNQGGTGRVSVTTSGVVNAAGDSGIYVITATATQGDVEITVNDDVSGRTGMGVTNSGAGNVIINVNAIVSSPITDGAISIAGTGDQRIVFGDGGNVGDGDNLQINASAGTATVEFTGTESDNRFTITRAGSAQKLQGVDEIVKSGSGTWTIDGFDNQGTAKTIAVNSGRLVLDIDNTAGEDTFFFKNDSPSITVESGATLEVASPLVFDSYVAAGATGEDVPMTLSGVLALTGADSTLGLDALTGMGADAEINIDVDFSGGDAVLDAPRLSVASVDGDPIAVNIRSTGEFPEVPEDAEGDEETVSIGNLIKITGTSAPGAFVQGRTLNGGFRFDLVHDDSSGESVWTVVAAATGGPAGIEGALYESLPAALAQLASLESHRQRLQGRQHGTYGGVWAKVLSASAEFEPLTTSLATYEIEDAVAEFGIDAPLFIAHPYIPGNFTVGATAAFGDATTDVTANVTDAAVPADTGKIETGSFKAAISVHWEYEGAYVDGQLQYATFDNDIGTEEMKLGSTNATAYSGGLEVGYGGAVGDLLVIPSAQLLWTSVDFEDFTDSDGMEIVLDDGVVVTGRAGVGLEYGWRGALYGDVPSGYVFLRGHADVLLPVDGDVNTRVNETEFVSKREDPVFDAGIGATYTWYDAYALSVDVSTQQGEEVEGYAGGVGFKYKF